ncbi:MAG: hypothetical protein ACYCP0_08840, partial [Acidiferrobacteraceae bacterium]
MNEGEIGARSRHVSPPAHHLFSDCSPEQRVSGKHPLHSIKACTDSAPKQILPVSEGGVYRRMSRPPIPPER